MHYGLCVGGTPQRPFPLLTQVSQPPNSHEASHTTHDVFLGDTCLMSCELEEHCKDSSPLLLQVSSPNPPFFPCVLHDSGLEDLAGRMSGYHLNFRIRTPQRVTLTSSLYPQRSPYFWDLSLIPVWLFFLALIKILTHIPMLALGAQRSIPRKF
jgi:hypothetical protein